MDYKTRLLFLLVTIIMLIYRIIAYPKQLYCQEEFSTGYGQHTVERFYFNNDIQKCVSFYYYGRGGTLNNFMTMNECRSACENVTMHKETRTKLKNRRRKHSVQRTTDL